MRLLNIAAQRRERTVQAMTRLRSHAGKATPLETRGICLYLVSSSHAKPEFKCGVFRLQLTDCPKARSSQDWQD
jgi:hypothetical protein